MFLNRTNKINNHLLQKQWTEFLNEDILDFVPKYKIRKMSNKIENLNEWKDFKRMVIWKWINNNFQISEKFIKNLNKNIKKLNLNLSLKEETFIQNIKELYFNSWRPLKTIITKFSTQKKESIYFLQSKINLHTFDPNLPKPVSFLEQGDFYFSNQKIILVNSNQKILVTFEYSKIKSVDISKVGTVIETAKGKYLVRGKNRYLTYIILQRMLPNLNLDINKYENLYDYFDFFNNISLKFN